MVNTSAAAPVKVPAVITTVNTPPTMVLVPAPLAPPVVKVRVPGEVTASPAPLSVIMILPVVGIVVAGVIVTVMTTPVAPLTALLRVSAGKLTPSVSVTMATEVPVLLAPMKAPAAVVVTTAIVVDVV